MKQKDGKIPTRQDVKVKEKKQTVEKRMSNVRI